MSFSSLMDTLAFRSFFKCHLINLILNFRDLEVSAFWLSHGSRALAKKKKVSSLTPTSDVNSATVKI